MNNPASHPSSPELPRREPGQAVTPDYLLRGRLRYDAVDRAIVGRNGPLYNNRPLYCPPESEGVVLAGDRPHIRLLAQPHVFGSLVAGIVRGNAARWFHDYRDVESRYRCGRMTWHMLDPDLPGLSAAWEVVPLDDGAGFAARLQVHGARNGDMLVWAFGGAPGDQGANRFGFWLGSLREQWDPIYRGNPNVCKTGDPRKPELAMGLLPDACRGNRIRIDGARFQLQPTDSATHVACGTTDRASRLHVADASAAGSPAALAASRADALPIVCGSVPLQAGDDVVSWLVRVVPAAAGDATPASDPRVAFDRAGARLQSIECVEVRTPDARLDAAVAAVCHAIDGACERNTSIFRHGCMAWSIHFLGWRVICGATALGRHELVKGDALHYFPLQVREDGARTEPRPDPGTLGCVQGPDSRFWGRGRLSPGPGHVYNTQSQFFDQVIRDWRATADPELERALRPALELHLEWLHDCFDPDDDGLYESYINTLPTDSVWYNGGGSMEESAYAYYGHLAARDLARNAGDAAAADRHDRRAARIRDAARRLLWVKDRGHYGLYVEQEAPHRVHEDAWVYSQFLPIDAGLASPAEALQALAYTEWGLERIRLPFGGELCQPSNWVPSKWSVRDMFGGDMWHHALAYCQVGAVEEGGALLLGALLESAYAGAVPGNFGHIGAGTDFADNSHLFARAVVEGLFGYEPDYPNGRVRIRPAIPSAWPSASIRTRDFSLEYSRTETTERCRVTLARVAELEFRLPVSAQRVTRVTVNGQPAAWHPEPAAGCTWICVSLPVTRDAELALEIAGRLPPGGTLRVAGNAGDAVTLAVPDGSITEWQDVAGVLENPARVDGALSGTLARKPGHAPILATVAMGTLTQRRLFVLHVTDREAEAERARRTPPAAPAGARWDCLNLASAFNGDVRTIFKQTYAAPRPRTCSVRLGTDGYSAWTFPYWKALPPAVELDHLQALTGTDGRIQTPQRVPFVVPAAGPNIAFTSRWDNWPNAITVPVGRRARTAWFLVCGMTFPMQLRIANAELRFRYADGVAEALPLVPPFNFWSLCAWGGIDYSYETDAFCLPPEPPPMVQLGTHCRAMVLSWNLRPDVEVKDISLETLSPDVVIGLMGLSLMEDMP